MRTQLGNFLDRLTERLTALVSGIISARMESYHATVQAEQQHQLEELARKYEAEGSPEIAQTLRDRSIGLTSTDLACSANDSIQSLTCNVASEPSAKALPNFGAKKPKGRRKKSLPNPVPQSKTPE